jgi:BirA family biotin operon repressor/biotin-[acetyl-CoA-carboxylase] ligase
MGTPALAWQPEALQACLQSCPQSGAAWPGLRVQVLAETDSTNTRLLEAARAGDAAPRLLVAERQTQGRGRNARVWRSAPAASLTFSLALVYAPADWSGLSLAAGVALADAIEPGADGRAPRLRIKWPNDLWLADAAAPLGGRKLGGILIETVAASGGGRVAVVGVGLNVQPLVESGEPGVETALNSGYACVQEFDPACTAPDLLARVAPPLLRALCRFEREGLAPFAAGFARRDLLYGRRVGVTMAGACVGVAAGIDAQGALRLLTGAGERRITSGEVSVRPLGDAGDAGDSNGSAPSGAAEA